MIAVDTNLLVYSHREDSPFHRLARELIDALRHDRKNWAIPLQCVHEFIGIVTHPRIYRNPTRLMDAFATVEIWGAGNNLQLLSETHAYLPQLREVTLSGGRGGPQIHEARVAAVCLHHGVQELWTADRDFSLFPQLKTRNPLVPASR